MPESTLAFPIVVVGGGHAAAQLCGSLAESGLGAQICLVSAEPVAPYHRPPLSKAFLKSAEAALQPLRPEAWYAEQGITLRLGDAAVQIDRASQRLTLASGMSLRYDRLVLATGARARRLPGWPTDLANVLVLRNAADAERCRTALHGAGRLTVLGGGFIGLEVAASARALGLAVTVLESAPRLLARSVSAELSAQVLATHQASGIDVRLGVAVGHPEVSDGRLQALTVDGQREPVELLLLGIGALPDEDLAREAGLTVANGIVVDAAMRSSDPAILAIGDCCSFPAHARAGGAAIAGGSPAQHLRLESVSNANDQARSAAATLLGRDEPFAALPWFWSEQGSLRLQMAGLLPSADAPELHSHRRPGAHPASFSLLHYVGERLVCVESANAPMDHLMARKLLEAGISPPPQAACDPAVALKSFL